MHKLKPNQPDFECVDGLFAGRKFRAGQTYTEIPENEKHRFEKIPEGRKVKETVPADQPVQADKKTVQAV